MNGHQEQRPIKFEPPKFRFKDGNQRLPWERPGKDFIQMKENDMGEDKKPKTRQDCRALCDARMTSLRQTARLNLNIPASLPGVLEKAIRQSRTQQQREQIVSFCMIWVRQILFAFEESRSRQLYGQIADADPSLFFSFCRKKNKSFCANVKKLRQDCLKQLEAVIPARKDQALYIADLVFRRMISDHSGLSPVLVGPPGAGKSFLVQTVSEVLNKVGIKTGFVRQVMTQTQAGKNNDELSGRLLGSSCKWSNGDLGLIYQKAAEHDVVLVFLDEAEKHDGLRDFMIGLLDPEQPLEDHFLKDSNLQVNMRHKVIFVLAANDLSSLNNGAGDPLWSRLTSVEVPAYSDSEMERLLVKKVITDGIHFCNDKRLVEQNAKQAFRELGYNADLRKVHNRINEMLYQQVILEEGVENSVRSSAKVISFNR